MAEVDVQAAARPEVVDQVLDELEALWARHDDVAAADRGRFETGLIEILGNIVEHAYQLDGVLSDEAVEERRLRVEVDVTPTALHAVLGDNGLPVELDLSEVSMPGADAESGRGLALAQASLDELRHERVGGRNRWTLRCDRAST